MADSGDGSYTLSWDSKPLGFSIVMDTTGKNAYVSSIQKVSNCEMGLRLAAQIIKVEDTNVVNMAHGDILNLIKNHPANKKIHLTFQPRSFANQKNEEKGIGPQFLAFKGATRSQNRVNGKYELCTQEMMPPTLKLDGQKYNNRPVWRRKSEEDIGDDQIYCWFWPKEDENNIKATKGKDVWMISRGSEIGKSDGGAYACVHVEKLVKHEKTEHKSFVLPMDINEPWQTYDPKTGKFEKDKLVIDCGKF